jgi:hypothetical protein
MSLSENFKQLGSQRRPTKTSDKSSYEALKPMSPEPKDIDPPVSKEACYNQPNTPGRLWIQGSLSLETPRRKRRRSSTRPAIDIDTATVHRPDIVIMPFLPDASPYFMVSQAERAEDLFGTHRLTCKHLPSSKYSRLLRSSKSVTIN